MVLVVPSASEADILGIILGKNPAESLVLRLFVNNYTPISSTTSTNFTEASGFGYSAPTLISAGWTITTATPSIAIYAEQTFTFSGALGTIYGYYIVRTSNGGLFWAERFDLDPLPLISTNGDELKITPRVVLS